MDPDAPRWHLPLVLGVALLASATSLGNRFALDDLAIIVNNARVHSLAAPWEYFTQTYWPAVSGAALYRPLTVLGFSVEWLSGGGAPVVFHLISVLLYLAACAAVYWLAATLLPRMVAVIAAVLFAAHPVHVEAVGNVVGQPEIVVGLLLPAGVAFYVRARRLGPLRARDGVLLTVLYAAALMVKEHAVVFPLLLILAELLIVGRATPAGTGLKRLAPLLAAQGVVLAGFWAVRTSVTGGLIGRDWHPAFRTGGAVDRLLIALGVVPEWARLLFFPWHLSADYNPQQIPVGGGFGGRQLLGIGLLVLLGIVVARSWHRRPVVAFGTLWFAIAIFPVSNVLLPTGILLAERTLFLPSVGAIVALAGAIALLLDAAPAGRQRPLLGAVALVTLVWAGRSAMRQPVWRDNATLFAQTALDAPRSYRARAAHGIALLESGREVEGEAEYRLALSLYRDDPNVFADLGNWYLGKQRYAEALPLYARVLELVPDHWAATSRSILCLIQLGRLEEARQLAQVATARGDQGAAGKLALVDSLIAGRAARVPSP